MRKLLACTVLLAGLIGLSGMAMAQDLPIPGVEPAKDQPGAHEYPDPKLTYKFVFDLAGGPDTPDKVNPGSARRGRVHQHPGQIQCARQPSPSRWCSIRRARPRS